ncbi:hypothetical protein [Spirosoma montaniterrae]|uniref:HTTM-like domain-containing protein n=1 Tax=Spirosoma montaniterrae TaxID=1178516 RepID=A0A1P9WTC6_9BACT|nr:hypothetical protein [Spirosoma montaniterrae]AQG78635.1 hypothetical protein AWR27_04360 [Spirosoma montaniterrae]
MKNTLNHLRQFWFAEAPAERLAALRIVLGLFTLGYLLPRIGMYREMSQQTADLFEPIGAVSWLTAPLPPLLFDALLGLTLLATVAFLLGWKFRLTGPLFALLLLLTMCYRNSWSMIFHNDNIVVLHALILGFAPAADAWSVDSVRRARFGSLLFGRVPNRVDWQYGWPAKLMMAVATAPYFLSGIAKLAGPTGLGWVTGEVMRDQVATDTLRKIVLGTSSSDAIYWLYDQPLLFMLLGLTTMVVELGSPFALASRKWAMRWAVVAWLMHWGILFVMDITFRYQLFAAMYACFFPAEYAVRWVLARFSRTRSAEQQPVLSES